MKRIVCRRTGSAPLLAAVLLACCACGRDGGSEQSPATDGTIRTTFYPMTYFAERLAGGGIPVECPVPADADPIFYKPGREELHRFRRAALIVANGAGFEKWIATASLPPSRLVETAAGLPGGFLSIGRGTHTHGGSTHSHEGIDGHTWLDPRNAVFQAEALAAAMVRAFPEHGSGIGRRLGELRRDLLALDELLAEVSKLLDGVSLLASHPAYNYLARRYGWRIVNFDLDPAAGLKPHELPLLRKAAAADRAVLLWEREPLAGAAARLEAELRIRSVVFSPVETPPPAGADYLAAMRANVDRLRAALIP